MKLLEQRIAADARVIGSDILKVDMFLNHCIDVALIDEMGSELYRLFCDCGVNKILTVEASGIPIACAAARFFKVPVVFAKKGSHKNVGDDVYTAEVFSFTKGEPYVMKVAKSYLNKEDKILIIDDFLANGAAAFGLLELCAAAGAEIKGIGIGIEKGFQPGGKKLRDMGINLKSLAIIDEMSEDNLVFRPQ